MSRGDDDEAACGCEDNDDNDNYVDCRACGKPSKHLISRGFTQDSDLHFFCMAIDGQLMT